MALLDTSTGSPAWPALPYEEWKDTLATLHLWTQVVGKVRLAQTPWVNHSWHVALYVTARGLTTSPIPYGQRTFEIEFDFLDHELRILTSDGAVASAPARPRAPWPTSTRSDGPPPSRSDSTSGSARCRARSPTASRSTWTSTIATYDAAQATRFWRVLVQADRVLKVFRARFLGKSSPVHFFWGSFDLAVTRFSGRRAPAASGRRSELARLGRARGVLARSEQLWVLAGRRAVPAAVFYAYAYPEPEGFKAAAVRPEAARLQRRVGRVHPALRRGASCGLAGRHAPGVPSDDVRGGRRSWPAGIAQGWSAARSRRPGRYPVAPEGRSRRHSRRNRCSFRRSVRCQASLGHPAIVSAGIGHPDPTVHAPMADDLRSCADAELPGGVVLQHDGFRGGPLQQLLRYPSAPLIGARAP